MTPGQKYYDRVEYALSHSALPVWSMRVFWDPGSDSDACKSTIGKYFSLSHPENRVELIETLTRQHQQYSLNVPILGKDNLVKNELYATPHELVEYIGMLSLGCNLECDAYLNSYRCNGQTIEIGYAKIVQWNGLFGSDVIVQLFESLK